jgi:hypothetical protein
MADRPTLTLENDPEAVEEFVASLQAAIDAWDADRFNAHFAGDALWGSPSERSSAAATRSMRSTPACLPPRASDGPKARVAALVMRSNMHGS